VAVQGTVKLDGHPIDAAIVFRPQKDVKGPQGGGNVVQGRFDVPAKYGAAVGNLHVEIWPRSEGDVHDIKQTEPPPSPVAIPARYNKATTLTVETTLDGPNQFDFELTSDK